ncbi:MAG: sulfite exporter TauE/SafE family protein [Gammaproteobacteria bacterium]|nr:sulfite exporter TauE/SafE family protein [Gammaproteobacteria bacterium]
MLYLLVGVGVGLLSGTLGLGGGVIIVPALHYLFTSSEIPSAYVMHFAVGTSLAVILPTSIVSTYFHHRRGAVLWSVLRALGLGILLGSAAGAVVAGSLPSALLAQLFGLFLIAVAIYTFFRPGQPDNPGAMPGLMPLFGVGGLIGSLSAILGIGGGSMTVPFLSFCGVDMRRAVATSAACGLLIALAGGIGFALAGGFYAEVPAGATGFVYWPAFLGIATSSMLVAPAGARLAHWLPVILLKRLFMFGLLVLGLRMVWP